VQRSHSRLITLGVLDVTHKHDAGPFVLRPTMRRHNRNGREAGNLAISHPGGRSLSARSGVLACVHGRARSRSDASGGAAAVEEVGACTSRQGGAERGLDLRRALTARVRGERDVVHGESVRERAPSTSEPMADVARITKHRLSARPIASVRVLDEHAHAASPQRAPERRRAQLSPTTLMSSASVRRSSTWPPKQGTTVQQPSPPPGYALCRCSRALSACHGDRGYPAGRGRPAWHRAGVCEAIGASSDGRRTLRATLPVLR